MVLSFSNLQLFAGICSLPGYARKCSSPRGSERHFLASDSCSLVNAGIGIRSGKEPYEFFSASGDLIQQAAPHRRIILAILITAFDQ
jgi:hypothetical protein